MWFVTVLCSDAVVPMPWVSRQKPLATVSAACKTAAMRWFLASALAFCLGSVSALAEGVTVFAASSLKTALDEIVDTFETETTISVTLSYAGSSTLARQIQNGAPADIFFSANKDWMDVLEAEELIAPNTRRTALGNTLVLIAAEAGPVEELSPDSDLVNWLDGARLAMALVDAVPAGLYGRAALQRLGLWDQIADQVAQTDNVRAALALVALGAAPYGLVYATDAGADPSVHIRATIPETSHPPIRYPVASVKGRESRATPFLDHLQTPESRAIFQRHGFQVLEE